ncbi:MAG: sugar transferase [Verrucomicrobiota bacterium]
MTGFGTWPRRTSFDELPELLTCCGEMSLVGPRPHCGILGSSSTPGTPHGAPRTDGLWHKSMDAMRFP